MCTTIVGRSISSWCCRVRSIRSFAASSSLFGASTPLFLPSANFAIVRFTSSQALVISLATGHLPQAISSILHLDVSDLDVAAQSPSSFASAFDLTGSEGGPPSPSVARALL